MPIFTRFVENVQFIWQFLDARTAQFRIFIVILIDFCMIGFFCFRVKEGRALVQVAKPLCLTDTNQKDAQPVIFTLEESTSHSPNNPNLMRQIVFSYFHLKGAVSILLRPIPRIADVLLLWTTKHRTNSVVLKYVEVCARLLWTVLSQNCLHVITFTRLLLLLGPLRPIN